MGPLSGGGATTVVIPGATLSGAGTAGGMDAGAFITAGLPLVPGTRYTGRVESEPLPNSATQSSAPAPTATTAPNAMTPLRSAFDVRGAAGCVTGVGR